LLFLLRIPGLLAIVVVAIPAGALLEVLPVLGAVFRLTGPRRIGHSLAAAGADVVVHKAIIPLEQRSQRRTAFLLGNAVLVLRAERAAGS